MRFEWDENKRRINLQNHQIDFADVWRIFENETASYLDNRFDYEETRFYTLGLLFGRVIAVSHTDAGSVIRIISARKANKNEQAKYYRAIAN